MNGDSKALMSLDFKEQVKSFKKDFYQKYKAISKETTPQVDGTGRKIIEKRPDGFDYIIEAYMREALDKHFPGWSWESAAPLHFLGSEWVVAQGHLIIIDEHLMAFGITPPVRKFYGVGAARIQYKKNLVHSAENIVDIDNNAKSANSKAFKYSINRLTHIGDDVYSKRIEEEGAGDLESILRTALETNPEASSFVQWVSQHNWRWGGEGGIFEVLDVSSVEQITDFKTAYEKVKEVKKL